MANHPFPNYPVHLEAQLLPPMTEGERDALAESILRHGLLEPIVLYRGAIAEGLHRYETIRALVADGHELPSLGLRFRELADEELKGGTFREWVLAKNCARRHLSASQIAVIAAQAYLDLLGNQESSEAPQGKLRPQFARRFGISERTLQDGITVCRSGDQATIQAVFTGLLTVHSALEQAKRTTTPRRSTATDMATPQTPATTRQKSDHSAQPSLPPVADEAPRRESSLVRQLQTLRSQGLQFGTIYASPYWTSNAANVNAAAQEINLNTLRQLPVAPLLASQAHLHLWTNSSQLLAAREVLAAWGFEYRCHCVCVGVTSYPSNYWRRQHELVLLGVHGDCPFATTELTSWFQVDARAPHEQSDEMRMRIQEVSPGPYLELFGHRQVPGWTVIPAADD